ncbi:hypothetical protein FOZG_12261 [Fusarium oxysporum Fo47]|uniref:Uncharacterized protein n=1 Tax=Fusarium oxysporum Fo47 TaxID=660027 RepID=W9JQI3_FUSOX|nr:hypothetical protein FOZG_12261 [Fusarium oxysporum Fo47]
MPKDAFNLGAPFSSRAMPDCHSSRPIPISDLAAVWILEFQFSKVITLCGTGRTWNWEWDNLWKRVESPRRRPRLRQLWLLVGRWLPIYLRCYSCIIGTLVGRIPIHVQFGGTK